MGTPTREASTRRVSVPAMAFAMPPPGSIAGLGSLVKKSQLTELAPFSTRWKKTRPSGAMTRMAQKKVPSETRKLNALRNEWLLADWKAIFLLDGAAKALAAEAHEQQLGE